MQRERKDNHFIKKPIYPGGLKAMRELIRKELKYPQEAFEAKIEGSVYLRYNINHKGKVTSSKVLSGIGYGCDEEAQRVVSKFKFEIPKNPQKLKVKFHKTIRIYFKLPKEQPTQNKIPSKINNQPTQLTYSVKPTLKKNNPQSPKKKSASYTYTIKY